MAKYFYDQIARQMSTNGNGASIWRVDVWETDTTRASYWPEAAGQTA